MSSYTVVDENDCRDILSRVQADSGRDLGAFESIRAIEEGYSNSVYAVRTRTKRFILKVIEESIDGFALASSHQRHLIQKICHQRGMRVAEVVGDLIDFKGRKAQLMLQVDGVNLRSIGPTQARLLGRRTAEFQVSLRAVEELCPGRRMNPLEMLLSEVQDSINRIKVSSGMSETAYLFSIGGLALSFILTRKELESRGVPKGITHADLNRGNVLFAPDGTEVAAFLDFDSIARGFLVRDLVKLMYEFAFNLDGSNEFSVDDEVVQSLIDGYSEIRPLSRHELEVIPIVLEMTSRWQASSHLKLHLVGRMGDDLAMIGKKHSAVRRSRKMLKTLIKKSVLAIEL